MTLFSLVLAIGIVENSSYYIEKGLHPRQAAIKAMSELLRPIMGITMALIAVFLPAAFLPGITGQAGGQSAFTPSLAPQLPPWMLQTPQPFVVPQRKF